MKIIALNDDCLLEIFSYLSVKDFCALRASHRRFNDVGDYYFTSKHMQNGDTFTIGKDKNRNETELVLKHFGHLTHCIHLKLFRCETEDPFFMMLRHCTGMRNLVIASSNLDSIQIDLMKIKTLKNIENLLLFECSGAEANFERLLNACDLAKLDQLHLNIQIPDDLLAFVASRMTNIDILTIEMRTDKPLNLVDLRHFNNHRNFGSFHIVANDEVMPLVSVIGALAEINRLKFFWLLDKLNAFPDYQTVEIHAITGALNNLSNVLIIIIITKRTLSKVFIENINRKMEYEYDHDGQEERHTYVFSRTRPHQRN